MTKCQGKTRKGISCNLPPIPGEKYCRWHSKGPKEKGYSKRQKEVSYGVLFEKVLSAYVEKEVKRFLTNKFKE